MLGKTLWRPPPLARSTATRSTGEPVGASFSQKAYGLPFPQRVPQVASSSTTCTHVPRGGAVTAGRGPQSSVSGPESPCAVAVMQRACAPARATKVATSIPITLFRSGQAPPIAVEAFVSAAATFAAVPATLHVPPRCAFLMHAPSVASVVFMSLVASDIAASRQVRVPALAPTRSAPWGPPKLRAASVAGSPAHDSFSRATSPAGVATAPYPALCTVAASGHPITTLFSRLANAPVTAGSAAAQGAPDAA